MYVRRCSVCDTYTVGLRRTMCRRYPQYKKKTYSTNSWKGEDIVERVKISCFCTNLWRRRIWNKRK